MNDMFNCNISVQFSHNDTECVVQDRRVVLYLSECNMAYGMTFRHKEKYFQKPIGRAKQCSLRQDMRLYTRLQAVIMNSSQ